MKPKSVAPQSAVMAVDRKLHNTWVYIKRHWQLYLLFLMPAVLLTLVFRYIPMGGVLIAFKNTTRSRASGAANGSGSRTLRGSCPRRISCGI